MLSAHSLLVAVCFVVSTSGASTCELDDSDGKRLVSGIYELRIVPSRIDIHVSTNSVVVGVTEEKLIIDVTTEYNTTVTMNGRTTDDAVKFGVTTISDDNKVYSYHFVGEAADESTARGDYTLFVDGEKSSHGTWLLKK